MSLPEVSIPQSKKVSSDDLPASDDVINGITSQTTAFDPVNCESTHRTNPTPRKRIRGDAFEEPPSVVPIDPTSDLAVIIMRNKGRPLGVGCRRASEASCKANCAFSCKVRVRRVGGRTQPRSARTTSASAVVWSSAGSQEFSEPELVAESVRSRRELSQHTWYRRLHRSSNPSSLSGTDAWTYLPPFVSPANLTRTRRAKKGVIPLLVIDGPMEPKHVHLLLQGVLADLRQLSTNGTRVWDALSKSYITVKAGPVCCHNDLPFMLTTPVTASTCTIRKTIWHFESPRNPFSQAPHPDGKNGRRTFFSILVRSKCF